MLDLLLLCHCHLTLKLFYNLQMYIQFSCAICLTMFFLMCSKVHNLYVLNEKIDVESSEMLLTLFHIKED